MDFNANPLVFFEFLKDFFRPKPADYDNKLSI